MCAQKVENDTHWINLSNGLLLYYHKYSFYSQKVLLALHEKHLPFESHIVDILNSEQYDQWFLELNPRGEVPVLRDGDKIISDSIRIIDHLDDNFSSDNIPKLIPTDEGHEVRQKVISYRNLLDHIPAGVVTIGSFYHPDLVGQPKAPFFGPVRRMLKSAEQKGVETLTMYAEKNPDQVKTLNRKVKLQAQKHQIVADRTEFLNILKQLEETFDKIEAELSETQWLCSESFSVADISLTVLLERLNQLGLEDYFWKNGKRPAIESYYERVRNRESYKKSMPDAAFHMKMFVRYQKGLVCSVAGGVGLVLLVGLFVWRKSK